MKKYMTFLTVLGVVGMLAVSSAFAKDYGPRGPKGPKGGDGKGFETATRRLDLTEEQRDKVKEMWGVQKEKLDKWKSQNHAKLEALRKQMKEIMDSRKKLHEDFMKELSTVLTDEQMKKLEKWGHPGEPGRKGMGKERRPMRIEGMFKKLNLTEAQQEQLKKLREETRDKLKAAEDPQAKHEILRDQMDKIRDILTEEQLEKFKEFHKGRGGKGMQGPGGKQGRRGKMGKPGEGPHLFLKGLKLTDEQKEQLEDIREKYGDKLRDADPEERREIAQEMREEIRSILTDEQKEQLRKKMQNRRGREGRKGKPGRKGRGPQDFDDED